MVRPRSVRWPVVSRGQPSQRRQSQPRRQSRPQSKNPPTPKSDPVQRPSPMRTSPDVVTDAARARVTALEAAISALGTADGAALKSLQEALHKAKQSAHIPPVGERLDACHQFIERAKKRLAKADADLLRLHNRVGRRASPIRSIAHRSRSSAHCSISTEGSEFRIAEDAGGSTSFCGNDPSGWAHTKGKSRFPWIQGRWWFHSRHAWKR